MWERDLSAIALQRTPLDVLTAAVAATDDVAEDGGTFAAVPEEDVLRMTVAPSASDPRFTQIRVRPGVGLGGYAMVLRRSAVVDDYARDSRISRDFVEVVAESEGLLGVACAPVLCRDRVEGLLYVGRRQPGRIDDRIMDRLEHAARYAAVGIEHAHERARQLALDRVRERERLAGRLHDSVAQLLFGIGAAAHRSRLTDDPEVLVSAMREIEQTAAMARRELRGILERLTEADDGLAFESRLEGEVRLFASRTGCAARVLRSGRPRMLPDLVGELVVDVALEGMRNAVKHAGALSVVAAIDYGPEAVELVVEPEATLPGATLHPGTGTACGLAALRSRARRLGGRLELEDEGAKKVLRLRLPVAAGA